MIESFILRYKYISSFDSHIFRNFEISYLFDYSTRNAIFFISESYVCEWGMNVYVSISLLSVNWKRIHFSVELIEKTRYGWYMRVLYAHQIMHWQLWWDRKSKTKVKILFGRSSQKKKKIHNHSRLKDKTKIWKYFLKRLMICKNVICQNK